VIWCAATLMALVSMASLAELAAAAQPEDARKEAQGKTKNTEPKKETYATVTIHVRLVDPETRQLREGAQNATVKIQGEEDSYPTDKDGKTSRLVVLPGAKVIVIQLSGGAKPCSVNVPVKEGNAIVTVLVEKLPSVKCSLQPQVQGGATSKD